MNLPVSDSELWFYGITILLFLLISAFFSAAETALTAMSRARIFQLVMDGNRRAEQASRLRRNKESLIGAILLGNNAVNIAASTIATSVTIKVLGNNDHALALVTVIMTILVVIFSEILPKTYAIQNAERVSLALAPFIAVLVKLVYPLTHAIQRLIRFPLKLMGVDREQTNTLISATDVIRGTIELHHREGQMIKQERDMLGSILDLNDIEVKDIMIHRTHVEMLDASLPTDAFVQEAVGLLHSRIPVWKGEKDNIVGVLHTKTLVQTLNQNSGKIDGAQILAICHKPWFIPETTSLRDQLLAFRRKRQHLAFVVDEYGAWLGIVTLEDIIEEIVGEIEDEHDEATSSIQKVSENIYNVGGTVPVRDINRQLDWNLPDEEASTIAGLLISQAETIPSVGEILEFNGYRFTVIGRSKTKVTRLRVEQLVKPSTSRENM
jgi:Mg2+/Co2+ transporter CorB